MKFYRKLVTALPGQGFRMWWYDAETKKVESWPLVGWAVYSEKPEAHECDLPNYCECEGDDSAIVVPLSADGQGDVEELTGPLRSPALVGILPDGKSFTDEEAASIYGQEAERIARVRAEHAAKAAKSGGGAA